VLWPLRLVVLVSVLAVAGLALGLTAARQGVQQATRPIGLHPANPHYFLFRGRPTLLISSGEHYGALINPDFDYVRYLDAQRKLGFNTTRVFTGSYVEPEDANPMAYENTLAPRPGRFLAPWARSETPGYRLGGPKFDLTRWDEEYFDRLKRLAREAGRRGIVLELTLFSWYYNEDIWRMSPLYVGNNINGVGRRPYQRVYELVEDSDLLRAQDALARKLVSELRTFDNVFFEVLNEPWGGPCDPSAAECSMRRWQDRMISLIWDAERTFQHRHMIAEDVGHGVNAFHGAFNLTLRRPNKRVSVYQYHYAPAAAPRNNSRLGKAIGDNETGARGVGERTYRAEGWAFILSGGSVFNNLDWGFTPTHEAGDFGDFRRLLGVLGKRASSGGPALQGQISFLKRFVTSFPFLRMRVDPTFVSGGLPSGTKASVLAERGRAYAVYIPRGPLSELRVNLPRGRYRTAWFDPVSGRALQSRLVVHGGGTRRLIPPPFAEDLALSVRRTP